MGFTVTPWDVKGEVDYDRLIKEFRVEKINVNNDPLLEENINQCKNSINNYKILSSYKKGISNLTKHYRLNKNTKNFIIKELIKNFKDIDHASEILLKNLELYTGKNYASRIKEKSRIKENLCKGHINLEYARVISLMLEKDIKKSIKIFNLFLEESKYFIYKNKSIKIINNYSELNNHLHYISGIISGDGHINKKINEIIIGDGDRNKDMLYYSKKFLINVKKIFKENFNENGKLIKKGNMWRLRINSSYGSRFMNVIYGISEGNKSRIIKVPAIIKKTDKERLFWRGIFDTDGTIRKGNKEVGFSTKSIIMRDEFINFCKKSNITTFDTDKSKVYIAEKDILKFSRIIGISHPRKQINLIQYLKKGASSRHPINKRKDNKLRNIIKYLVPYKNNVYVRLTENRENVKRKDILERMKFIQQTLNLKIIEVKRNRKNNHFYICSKKLLNKINKNYLYAPTWKALTKQEVNKIKSRWDSYE